MGVYRNVLLYRDCGSLGTMLFYGYTRQRRGYVLLDRNRVCWSWCGWHGIDIGPIKRADQIIATVAPSGSDTCVQKSTGRVRELQIKLGVRRYLTSLTVPIQRPQGKSLCAGSPCRRSESAGLRRCPGPLTGPALPTSCPGSCRWGFVPGHGGARMRV